MLLHIVILARLTRINTIIATELKSARARARLTDERPVFRELQSVPCRIRIVPVPSAIRIPHVVHVRRLIPVRKVPKSGDGIVRVESKGEELVVPVPVVLRRKAHVA